MKRPRQNSSPSSDSASGSTAASAQVDEATTERAEQQHRPGYTPPKGKATPKRRDQEIKRGVRRDPHALSTAQASQRRKELKKSMSKEEWKEFKRKEREETRERNRHYRERMDAGDERYLLDRDKGKVRGWVRDWVDSRRFLSNLFMPLAVVMLVVMLFANVFPPAVLNATMIVLWVVIAVFFIDAIVLGRRANKAAAEKFPGSAETGFRLGSYAVSRATQPRRWRTPRPRVELGADV
ncbi:DUF3043 domain-containing protein [Corynebacterium uterequi]|uniref:Putative DUF3043 family protein n=1 Tax=Corynebacterium uterequi TaxID=1072256 RepID=A0A0G3HDV5_9CORY|nr:DUF3043 domain-containing protein [Corynebacterium uterequi]AKK11499.1 putative DUF3043 family protein [Corynebacterium uterequi]